MDHEEVPPPPYSAVDPLAARANNSNGQPSQNAAPLHGTGSTSQEAGSSRIREPSASTASAAVPTHFTSAASYFEERPPTSLDNSGGLLHHHMTIYSRSQAKDFPRRPRCWAPRTEDISQQDWDTFLRYLFPAQLGLAASSQHLPRQLRAEIQRDRKDRSQETDEQRRARIAAVIDEWNECFFEPRAACIAFVYVGEVDAAPTSALCPRCYPAATRATQSPGMPSPVEGQAGANSNIPSPVAGQHTSSPNSWPIPPHHPFLGVPPPMPYGIPFGGPQHPAHVGQNGQQPLYYPPPPPPQGFVPWQWNTWHNQPQFEPIGMSKDDGPLSWISSLTSKAQKYSERFAEQAQHYARQVEEQARARGRWFEEQARLQGQNQGIYASGYHSNTAPSQIPWGPCEADQPAQAMHQSPDSALPTTNGDRWDIPETRTPHVHDNHPESSRRSSVSSVSSDASFSSIETLSTTSDLNASDLVTVRTQLQSLHDCHDRTLYEAAVDLRRQLSVLQESRREARTSSRNWRAGSSLPQNAQPPDSTDWGRWDSPEKQERQSTERRVMKEELRVTKKAFREVVRRAREEQRDKRRARKHRRRHAKARKSEEAKSRETMPGRMQNLSIDDTDSNIVRSQTMPAVQAAQVHHPIRSETNSELNVPGVIQTPSTQANLGDSSAEGPEKKAKLKSMLKPRKVQKQQKDSEGESSKKASKKAYESS